MIRSSTLMFAAALAVAAPVAAQDAHQGHTPQPAPRQAPPQSPPQPAPPPAPTSQPPTAHEPMMPGMPHDPAMHGGMAHEGMQHGAIGPTAGAHDMTSMTSVLGAYPMTRDASGTSWQPDASAHGGVHAERSGWSLMGHVLLNGVYDWQDGPRGDEKAFVSGMIMGSARRSVGADGVLNLRAMLSPDPFMGASGYPLLFAAGESADGATTLVDRQHPHDLFMELSASYAHRLSHDDSVFVYGGLPGEPAFGPPAFMHRQAAIDSPEAPLSHHWLDSTHITYGVVTAGWVHRNWKLEASRFRGREPDQDRYDIESGDLDSTSWRVSWNPSENWALQASWADIASPEALEPDEDEERLSASALYTRGPWSATAAFGRKERSDGVSLDAWVFEGALRPSEAWTLFTRAERIETDELEPPGHGPIRAVAKISLGAVHDWPVAEHASIGVGALVSRHFAPDALEPAYGGDPTGAMAFIRLKIE